jgi:hypothetical protein
VAHGHVLPCYSPEPVDREARIVEPASLLPVAGVVLGVVLKWAFDALTERGKQSARTSSAGGTPGERPTHCSGIGERMRFAHM